MLRPTDTVPVRKVGELSGVQFYQSALSAATIDFDASLYCSSGTGFFQT